MSTAHHLKHFIGGTFTDDKGEARRASLNPSDPTDVVADAPLASAETINRTVAAASGAFDGWRAQGASARGNLLYAWADAVHARREEISQAVCREVGKPIAEARGETGRCVALLRYYAGEAVRPSGAVIPESKAGGLQYAVHQPVGVAALITPWNFPIAIPLWKAAPALAFGNTVVLKPSELSPYSAALLAETALAAGLPAGVLNVVFGAGATGGALVAAPEVSLVSFTGSSAAGAAVAEVCALRNVKYQTEMGGKNVGIVLSDADIDRAATLVAGGAMRYAGQKCTATSRVVVDKRVLGRFVDALTASVGSLTLGPVTDATAAVGPVITAEARLRIEAALDEAKCEFVCGYKPADAEFAAGYFVQPTVGVGVQPASPLAQDEIFGPVLAVIEADGLDDALEKANGVRYGLSAAIYTRDIASALAYIDRIQAGMVRVNGDTTGVDPHAPFGGVKGSGSHSREQGQAAREFYTEIKTVEINP
ncbi:MAG: aldehyde dehydrogenase family protein [Fimbriimonadaceae bacterium]